MPTRKRRGSLGAVDAGKSDETSSDSQPQQLAKRRKKTTYDVVEVCQELFDTIRNYKNSEGCLLCEPLIKLPNRRTESEYYNVVSCPIDFLRIQQKLKAEEYRSVDMLSADVELLIDNAKAYYKETCDEHGDACLLWELYVETRTVLVGGESTAISLDDNDVEDEEEEKEEAESMEKSTDAPPVEPEKTTEPEEEILSFPMSLRLKPYKDFKALISPRSVLVAAAAAAYKLQEDTSSRDGRSSIGDDENSMYEQLLGTVMSATENGRTISEMFRILPPKAKYPEYFRVIKHPIDLHIIAQKIQANEYTSLDDMMKDLNLMVQNAKLFNEPGSQIHKDATSLRRVMLVKRQELEEVRTTSRPVRSERIRSRRTMATTSTTATPRPSEVLASLQPSTPTPITIPDEESDDGAEEESAGEADMAGSSDEESSCWLLYSAVRAYRNEAGHPISDPFVKLPNRKIYPDYYEEIKMPMSLMKIEKKIQNNRYASVEDLALDMDVMFENAKKYNRDESQLYKDAVALQGVVRAKCRELFDSNQIAIAGSPSSSLSSSCTSHLVNMGAPRLEVVPPPVPLQLCFKEDTWSAGAGGGATVAESTTTITKSKRQETEADKPEIRKRTRRPPEDLLQRRLTLLYKTLCDYQVDGRYPIRMFMTMPSKQHYPDYYQVISEPIDMTIIDMKIKADKYLSVHHCINDFELMFNNARHYNEESSAVYRDADLLEKVLRTKLRSLRPIDSSPVPHRAIAARRYCKAKRSMTPMSHKLKELYNTIKDHTDGRGRIMSTPFMKLPQKNEYPDYYEVIRRPIDMQRIMQKLLGNHYNGIEDIISDFVLMFDNACRYNEPDSLIYKDALTLQRLCLEKKQELCANDVSNRVPDVMACVQTLLTNLFIATYNHTDEEDRCYSDSFLELPSRLPEEEEEEAVRQIVDGDDKMDEEKPKPKSPPSFEKIKRNLDRGRYQRVDRFQQDMFEVFQYSRKVSPIDSQVYEDAAELQMFMIRTLDELCENGERLLTPALSYTQRHLAADLETERQRRAKEDEAKGEGEKEDGKEGEERKGDDGRGEDDDGMKMDDVKTSNIDEHAIDHQDQTYHIGDFVYIEAREKAVESHIVSIEKIWREETGEAWFSGCLYLRPNETYQLATRKYLQKEVFKSDIYDRAAFSKVIGKCFVMFVKDYFKLKPEGYEDKDVFVCESRYSSRTKSSKKIKIWPSVKHPSVQIINRDEPLTPNRVVSQFVEKPSVFDESTDLDDGEPFILDVDRQVVVLERSSVEGTPVCTYYEQFQTEAGWFKLGDYVYVNTDEEKPVITRIDKMWTSEAGESYIHGPYFVPPTDIEHTPTRLFYEREVFHSCPAQDETNAMSAIVGRCTVLSYRDFCSERPTHLPESATHVCESKYTQADRCIKKSSKPLKRPTLSYKVCDDEVYFFKKPIIPHKEPSPLLMLQASGPSSMDLSLVDESSQMTMESNFNDSCSQFGSGDYPDSLPPLEMTNEKKKKKKKSQISGYITYAAECRKDIQNQNPDLSFGEISKIVGAKWRGLDKSEKEVFEVKARRIQEAQQLKQKAAEKAFNDSLTYPAAQSPDPRGMSPATGGRVTPGSTAQLTAGMYGGQGNFSPHPNSYQQYTQGMSQSSNGGPNAGQHMLIGLGGPNGQALYSPARGALLGPSTPGRLSMASLPGGMQMGPPTVPPRPPSPMFVSVPPRTQRLLHSEAYLKYIDGLSVASRGVSNWQKSLNATADNTSALSGTGHKLPVHWLANGVGHHDSAVNALWALHNLMMKDTLTLSRTLNFTQLW